MWRAWLAVVPPELRGVTVLMQQQERTITVHMVRQMVARSLEVRWIDHMLHRRTAPDQVELTQLPGQGANHCLEEGGLGTAEPGIGNLNRLVGTVRPNVLIGD